MYMKMGILYWEKLHKHTYIREDQNPLNERKMSAKNAYAWKLKYKNIYIKINLHENP